MIRAFEIENKEKYRDFEIFLFSNSNRIIIFDFPNDTIKINNIDYQASTFVNLETNRCCFFFSDENTNSELIKFVEIKDNIVLSSEYAGKILLINSADNEVAIEINDDHAIYGKIFNLKLENINHKIAVKVNEPIICTEVFTIKQKANYSIIINIINNKPKLIII